MAAGRFRRVEPQASARVFVLGLLSYRAEELLAAGRTGRARPPRSDATTTAKRPLGRGRGPRAAAVHQHRRPDREHPGRGVFLARLQQGTGADRPPALPAPALLVPGRRTPHPGRLPGDRRRGIWPGPEPARPARVPPDHIRPGRRPQHPGADQPWANRRPRGHRRRPPARLGGAMRSERAETFARCTTDLGLASTAAAAAGAGGISASDEPRSTGALHTWLVREAVPGVGPSPLGQM